MHVHPLTIGAAYGATLPPGLTAYSANLRARIERVQRQQAREARYEKRRLANARASGKGTRERARRLLQALTRSTGVGRA